MASINLNSALYDIAFLANSDNCVAVTETLVDASRVTISRILHDLEARERITRSGNEYTATPPGE